MHEDTTIPFTNPAFQDELSELVREGAQRIIRQTVEAELGAFLEEHSAARDARGRHAVVRNGYLPSREVLTGIGPGRSSRISPRGPHCAGERQSLAGRGRGSLAGEAGRRPHSPHPQPRRRDP